VRDYALLKVNRKTPAYLILGGFSEMKLGDDLIAWGFPFGLPGPVLIKASVATTLQANPNGVSVQAMVFQGPNNKGMSGGPLILNRTGRVLGITSNRIAGIGKELDETRQYIRSIQGSGSVRLMGVDPNAAIVALTDTLDKFLMSGMGVAISVDHIQGELPMRK
jgi:S1-C subfamily serine protease